MRINKAFSFYIFLAYVFWTLSALAQSEPPQFGGSEDQKLLERIEFQLSKLIGEKTEKIDRETLERQIVQWTYSLRLLEKTSPQDSSKARTLIINKISEIQEDIFRLAKIHLGWTEADVDYHEKEYSHRFFNLKKDIQNRQKEASVSATEESVWVLKNNDSIGTQFLLSDRVPANLKGNTSIFDAENKTNLAFIPKDDLGFYQGKTFAEAIKVNREKRDQARSGELSGSNETGLWLRFSDEAEIKFYPWDFQLPDLSGKGVELFSKQSKSELKEVMNRNIGEIREWTSFHFLAEIPAKEFETLNEGWTPEKLIRLAAAESSFAVGNCKAVLKNIPKD